jgi:hypothetical protein
MTTGFRAGFAVSADLMITSVVAARHIEIVELVSLATSFFGPL